MFVDHTILMLFSLASATRLISLFVSVANEKKLKKKSSRIWKEKFKTASSLPHAFLSLLSGRVHSAKKTS
jgi:isoprenylcysteine carboxyl methyltransferase (ICMT) family protein YpbQ